MSVWALPHERNGSRCPICGRPVYFTGPETGWQDRHGQGSHRMPPPRTGWPT